MTEAEYVTTSNLARVRAAQAIVGQIVPESDADKRELAEIAKMLEALADRKNKEIKIEQ